MKGCKVTTGHARPKQQQGPWCGPAFGLCGAVVGMTGLWMEQMHPGSNRRKAFGASPGWELGDCGG